MFHAFSTDTYLPDINMAEHAGYDYRMGTMTVITDANNITTTAGYDTFGRMTSVVKQGDSTLYPTIRTTYSDTALPFQYVVEKRDTSGDGYQQSQKFYNGMGQLIQSKGESTDPISLTDTNVVADTKYDGLSETTQASQPRYVATSTCSFYSYCPLDSDTNERWTLSSYDPLGRATQITSPDSTSTAMTYTLGTIGPLSQVIDANKHQTQSEADIFGRLSAVREYTGTVGIGVGAVLSATTVYTYSPLDLLTNTQDNQGNVITMKYDPLGRKISMSDPDMGGVAHPWQYTYDPNGNLTQQTDAKGQVITFTYDIMDRLTQKIYSTGAPTAGYSYGAGTYGKGLRTSMSVGGTSTNWTYDNRGRVAEADYTAAGNGPYSYLYSYDSADRLTSATLPNGEVVTSAYDAAWRQTSLSSSTYSTNYITATTYNALSQPRSWTLGNGLTESEGYTSPMSRPITHTLGTLFGRSYSYDNVGNVSYITNTLSSEVQQFTYDPLDRLTSWTLNPGIGATQNYNYDTIGNLTSKAGTSYTYGGAGNANCPGPHQLCISGTGMYNYDTDGNPAGANILTTAYTWNVDNQLTKTVIAGTQQGQYTYDADGQRATLQVGSSITTTYLGPNYEIDQPSGNSRVMYSYGGQVIAQRSTVSGVGTLIYLTSDHLGSASLATNNTGSQVSSQDFDPWGLVRSSSSITQTAINYTGQHLDSASSLLYYNSRYYDPRYGRFLTADTIVPGMAMGAGGALGTLGMDKNTSMKGLTVDYHEPGMTLAVNQENQFTAVMGFYFQLSNQDKQKAKAPYGPLNPQALNRYSYVLDNPLRYTDPTGHYHYDIQYGIGDITNVTPEAAMQYLQQHPNELFPWNGNNPITDLTDPNNNTPTIQLFHVYKLNNVNGIGGYNVVMVIAISDTSFTFIIVDPKSFEPIGGIIIFRTYMDRTDGEIYLRVTGITPSMGVVDGWIPGIAVFVWLQLGQRLANHFYDHPSPSVCC